MTKGVYPRTKPMSKITRDKISKSLSRDKSPLWKGGRAIHVSGYIMILYPNHPSIKNTSSKYVFEHILVMEKSIGRRIEKGEIIHHKNGDKQDNRIENLELTTRSEHMKHHGEGLLNHSLNRYKNIGGL